MSLARLQAGTVWHFASLPTLSRLSSCVCHVSIRAKPSGCACAGLVTCAIVRTVAYHPMTSSQPEARHAEKGVTFG